jgi:hypothetical protein
MAEALHPSFQQAHETIFHMMEYANEHRHGLGYANVDKINGHLGSALKALSSATKVHNTPGGQTAAMLELSDVGHHVNQAAKAFDIRDEMGQRVDYPLSTQILQAQMGEQQKEFVHNYANDINEGRKNGSKY